MKLTRSKILKMEAGQELDMIIAKVFLKMSVEQWNNAFFAHRVNYSTNIADAWRVVEKMRSEWPDYDIGNHASDNKKWHVIWGHDGYGWRDVVEDTAPLAICKAALLSTLDAG